MNKHAILTLALALLFGCGPGTRATGDAVGASADSPGAGDGAPLGMAVGCTSDLRSTVDAQGDVVMQCADDQGCAAGVCVAACSAAAASHGSVGCDFVIATPSFYPISAPPCFAVFLANNWPTPALVTVERSGHSYAASAFGRVPDGTPSAAAWPALPASGVASSSVAVLFMSHDPTSMNGPLPMTCPVEPALSVTGGTAVYTGPQQAETNVGAAWHITTSVPVSAYDILPYGGAASFLPAAELLLPTTAWGTNYVAAGPTVVAGMGGPGFGQIVAAEDDTTIEISPPVTLPSSADVAVAPANQTTSYHLDHGDYLQWQDTGLDMSGSVIQATKPVSYTGGSGLLCLSSMTSTGGACDSSHQQIPPVSALGSMYVASPYATRRRDLQEESIRYRLVGVAAGTQLTFDPPVSAPLTLTVGQVAEVEATGPFTITSQDAMHPFYLGQYMSGCLVTSGSRPGSSMNFLGDEEFVNILPPPQWLSSYVFFTDPTYATTNLVLVRKITASGFQDVTVDCLGVVGGWQPVAGGAEYEITIVDLQRLTPVGSCTNGRHVATSAGAFAVTVWGLDNEASYAYPAGGNVGTINPVVVIP